MCPHKIVQLLIESHSRCKPRATLSKSVLLWHAVPRQQNHQNLSSQRSVSSQLWAWNVAICMNTIDHQSQSTSWHRVPKGATDQIEPKLAQRTPTDFNSTQLNSTELQLNSQYDVQLNSTQLNSNSLQLNSTSTYGPFSQI